MNKALSNEDLHKKTVVDDLKTSADIDTGNYKVFQKELDISRTLRIYKSLAELSKSAVDAVTSGRSSDFSVFTDKMRPLMSYINDNNVKLTAFLDENSEMTSELAARDPNIRTSVITLHNNIKRIQSVRETMGAVPFNKVFLASEELTNAFLDYKLDLAWDFQFDVVILINLEDVRLIDYLVKRGQKRFILAGGSLEATSCKSVIETGGLLYKLNDHEPLTEQGGMPSFPGRPMHRFSIIDVGEKPLDQIDINKIGVGTVNERNNQWGRFNTINRADATRVLDNLSNMATYEQTSVFHEKFKGRAAVIVCPGPSLKKNVELLKKLKGKVLIISVLHALKELHQRNINPDIVVHVDPADLKTVKSKKGGEDVSYWDQWITANDMSKVEHFVVSNYSKPDIFEVEAKNVMWMSSGLPIGDLLPNSVFDYSRVGGSVSHSCFDLAVELGCSSIALIGQDLAFAKDGKKYSDHADIEMSEEELLNSKLKVFGNDVEVKGWFGKNVISNNTFKAFAQAYEIFARQVEGKKIQLYNCTEGGVYLEGFEHCRFADFIDKTLMNTQTKSISDILSENLSNTYEKDKKVQETKKFIVRNRVLAREIGELIKDCMNIAGKKFHSDNELIKFDRLQNKMIKKMGKNKFYSLGLQRDIHILQAGLKADPSTSGQLGFHLDFLTVAKDLNKRFTNYFSDQFDQLK